MSLTDPIRRIGERLADASLKYMPDPYVFVIVLTVLAFLGALGVGATPVAAMNAWYDGVWVFLTFMAQFAVILMTGDAIAKSPAVTRVLERAAKFPSSQGMAVAFTSFTAMMAGLISWGLGLIVGAVMAKQVAYQGKQKGLSLHYPLLAAAGYTALMIWHSGITSSSGLLMASEVPENFPGYVEIIPFSATVGSPVNLVTVALLLVVVPAVMSTLHPKDESDIRELPDSIASDMSPVTAGSGAGAADDGSVSADGGAEVAGRNDPVEPSLHERRTPADRLDESVILTLLIAAFPAYYFIKAWFISGSGFSSLTLNSINAFFLFSAIVLWKTPQGIVEQMEESAENVAGIIFQFPFYAGISGLVTGTALASVIANFFAGFATTTTWPVIGLISAGIMNVFVPSGGGQWVAQGPILLETTRQLGMPLRTAVLIEMMGDQLTNMIQPFWALPLLALADLRARDIIGYSTVAMIAGFLVMSVTMTLFLGVWV